ncbi:hypothetical protein BU24DRAFT_73507 [Aaosphaeria arxii CBS 175.79]|uniref:F-box domain-containing protein n=1 Tax=Aaosphaeria arxii CBS 175.79 TaxID=1450172 RepID=A0A6A5XBF9_9PLEO|nr:uncharacterized protein BU24DRAFT_73507 [Aaosphaeria arxii CBS 175.79]KAF2010243.1 hypothetical protein BU24DRAFT_73507 [Aaosphaeria arxii CBS 175.79]
MPTELILLIGGHMSEADYLSLEASCRHFRYMLQGETKKGFHLLDRRKEMLRRIKRHICCQAAHEELEVLKGHRTTSSLLSLGKLFCSYCTSPHPVHLFKPDAILESLVTRVCRGAAGVIWVCKHRQMTFTEVKNAIPRSKAYAVYLCLHPDHYRDFDHPYLFDEYSYIRNTRADEKWFLHNNSVRFKTQPWGVFDTAPLRLGVSKINTHLCPHLRCSDKAFFDLMFAPIRRSIWAWPYLDTWSIFWCPHKNCYTRFFFMHLDHPQPSLQVQLALGNVLDPTAQEWLSHVQDKTY